MTDSNDRLYHYNQELENQQRIAAAFAQLYPHLEETLGDSLHDPHSVRMLNGVNFLNADIHNTLDAGITEYEQSLLNTLYPHYQAPMPAMGVVQLLPKTAQKAVLPKGSSIRTDPTYGEACIFTTCYPVDVLPIEVTQATLTDNVLRLTLTCPPSLTFDSLQPERLRFFINAQQEYACLMYEWVMSQTTELRLNHISLDKQSLQPVGFTAEEGMLPYTSRTFIGYRLLMEYFHFPEKFLFFDVQGLSKTIWSATHTAQLEFHFKAPQPLLTKHLNARWFQLGCTPMVNLFPLTLEPFELTYKKTEYQLIPDERRIPEAMEVHTLQRVRGVVGFDGRNAGEYLPLYGKQYNAEYPLWGHWYLHRKKHMFLSIFDPTQRPNVTISIEALCTNRHLPSELPSGGNEPRLQHDEVYVRSLLPLTPTRGLYKSEANPMHWQLITHLATHYFSLSQGDDTLQNLRNILQLYDVHHNAQAGLLQLSTEPARYRSPRSRSSAFRQGIHVILVVDETQFTGTSLYLFGCMLERFLALYVTVEGFTQLTIITQDKKTQYQWPPRAGEQLLN